MQQTFYMRGFSRKRGWKFWFGILCLVAVVIFSALIYFTEFEMGYIFTIVYMGGYGVFYAFQPEAFIIDTERQTLRKVVGFGYYVTQGRPLSDYKDASLSPNSKYMVKLTTQTGSSFVAMAEAESFCAALNAIVQHPAEMAE
ncbi:MULTISPECIES: hypothetical protein [Bacteroidales]|uniref:hypothetical protein n=1 Tax=Bacteroidales TaxID=171549 RepID=UPI00359FE798